MKQTLQQIAHETSDIRKLLLGNIGKKQREILKIKLTRLNKEFEALLNEVEI